MALEDPELILRHAGTFKTKTVHVPAWDDDVLVRGMTMKELEIHQAAKYGEGEASASLAARCVIKASGARVFNDSHIGQLANLQVVELNPIIDAILTLSGLTEEGAEEVLGKSETTSSDSPSSESPETSDAPSEKSSAD